MNGPLRLALDEAEQLPRLAALRTAHPEVILGADEFGTWQAVIPEANGETVTTRRTLSELLDKLDSLLEG